MSTGRRNEDREHRLEPTHAKGAGKSWKIKGVQVSVMTREDAGVDSDMPWIASCDSHGEMLSCSTKANAIAACRYRDWCSHCRAAQSLG